MNVLISALSLALAAAGGAGMHAPTGDQPARARSTAKTATPVTQQSLSWLTNANRRALLEPTGAGFVNAVQVYPWSEGALYRLFTAPGLVTPIFTARDLPSDSDAQMKRHSAAGEIFVPHFAESGAPHVLSQFRR